MADGLLMKYFVLKPGGEDAYAVASRAAMREYAAMIEHTNQQLAHELLRWANREQDAATIHPTETER